MKIRITFFLVIISLSFVQADEFTTLRRLLATENSLPIVNALNYFSNHNDSDYKSIHSLGPKFQLNNKLLTPLSSPAVYLPLIPHESVSDACKNDLSKIVDAISDPEKLMSDSWVLKLLDSWGKYEGGFLQGNTRALGFFDECVNLKIDKNTTGSYCLVSFGFSNVPTNPLTKHLKFGQLPNFHSNRDQNSSNHFLQMLLMQFGTCIPSSCSPEAFKNSVEKALSSLGLTLKSSDCQTLHDKFDLNAWDWFGIIAFVVIGSTLVTVSCLDIYLTLSSKVHLKKDKVLKFFLIFSVPYNMNKIFNLQTQPRPGTILSLHGIRFLSITWVVLGHQYAFAASFSSNWPIKLTQPFLFQTISNADKSVDTFFVLSGLLVSYHFFRLTSEGAPFSIVKFYLLRILRLAPPIIAMVLFYGTISKFMVYGPFAPQYRDVNAKSCQTYWWVDWTFLSNFVSRFNEELTEIYGLGSQCIGQSWYVSTDMQLYLFMPLILLPIWYYKIWGLSILWFMTVLSCVIPAWIAGVNRFTPIMITPDPTAGFEYMKKIYMMPYCRASPYLVGIAAGYILWNNSNKKIVLKKHQILLGWFLAAAGALTVLYGIYPFNYITDDIKSAGSMPLWYIVVYNGLQRMVWGAAVAWVVIASEWGYGGFVSDFLSYAPFQPLSRLTYCIYLTSLPVYAMILSSFKRVPYYDNVTMIGGTCGTLFISGIAALLLSLAVEAPVINVQRLIFNEKSKPVKGKMSTTTTVENSNRINVEEESTKC